jgi:hypothetical protein
MKMTIVTDSSGNLIGAVHGHSLSQNGGGVEAAVAFAGGHKLHQVEVEDDMATIRDAAEFERRLRKHIPKH